MLQARQLKLERHFEPVFAPIDLTVRAGELWLVTGANGSGKTTLIRLLAGLLRPSGGELVRSEDNMAYLGHQSGLKGDLTVTENLEFHQRLAGGDGASVEEAVRRVGLATAGRQPVRTLSAGQRKRCALARLLLAPAPLWLLDEPYANLDAEGVEMVDRLLEEQLDAGRSCVMSTHGALRPPELDWRELTIEPPEHRR